MADDLIRQDEINFTTKDSETELSGNLGKKIKNQGNDSATNDFSPTPMIRQYLKIKADHQDCLLLFRMGDFYELFFEDAKEASKILDIALTSRGKYLGEQVPMCGVPHHAVDFYIAKLVRANKKVAMCDQTESPQEAKRRGSKSVVSRAVTRIITVGTALEDEILSSVKNNFLLSIVKHKRNKTLNKFAVAALDISTGDFFVESSNALNLKDTVMKYLPTEVVVQNSEIGNEAFSELRSLGVNLSAVSDVKFNYITEEKRVRERFSVAFTSGFGDFSEEEIVAIGVLSEYVMITQKSDTALSPPKKIDSCDYVQISSDTMRNLEIWMSVDGNESGSLFAAIDETKTSVGRRLLVHRVSFPIKEIAQIEKRLDSIDFFLNNMTMRQKIINELSNCPDFERALSRLKFMKGSPRDLGSLLAGLKTYASVINTIKNFAVTGELHDVVLREHDFSKLQNKLSMALADNLQPNHKIGGYIRNGYNAELDNLRALKSNHAENIRSLQNHYITEFGIQSLKIKTNNMIGWFIEIPLSQKQKVPEEFLWKQTISNSVRYTTLELDELQNALVCADAKIINLEISIFNELVSDVLEVSNDIYDAAKGIAVTDIASSFADIVEKRKFVRPILKEDAVLDIKNGRHVVVESLIQNSIGNVFVPNDCDFNQKSKICVVTGPNMAGKSTFLRQNALIVLLAHIGLFVPADFALIGTIDRLFSRIGAYDNLSHGKSTFMVEMIETAAILNQATDKSFVILDEIGRGTSTFDGMAIAYSVVKHIHERNACRTLFSTHYHELSELVKDFDSVTFKTLQITESKDDIIFQHKVTEGVAWKSYGIHVARLAGVPMSVVVDANNILKVLERGAISLANSQNHHDVSGNFNGVEEVINATNDKLKDMINSVDVDDLSPKDALNLLYELKSIALND